MQVTIGVERLGLSVDSDADVESFWAMLRWCSVLLSGTRGSWGQLLYAGPNTEQLGTTALHWRKKEATRVIWSLPRFLR